MNPNLSDRIIVPLDVSTPAEAIALLDRLPDVQFWKLGLELFVSTGPTLLDELKQRHKRIFLDLKFHDIPNTLAGACRAAARYGVDFLTVHTTAGRIALQEALRAAREGATQAQLSPPHLLGITLLTSLNTRDLAFDLKIPLELPEYTLHLALLAQESGLGGAVCSPQEVAQLRSVLDPSFLLVCPGVRPSWAAGGDQQRTLTPQAAFQAGANYLVIGRPITAHPNPPEAWRRITDDLSC